MSDPFTRFDRDPDALAWARSKVQAEVDRARMLGEEAAAVHNPEQSEVWHRLANRMQRVLVDGTGCLLGAFDERLLELVAEIDTLRAAEPTAPADFALAPPAPQEPTVTDRTPQETLTAAAEKLRGLGEHAAPAPWWGDDLDEVQSPLGVIATAVHGDGKAPFPTSRYIAALHPTVGAAMADWLDAMAVWAREYPEMAHDHDRPACEQYACDVMGRGIAFARQIVGEAS